MDCTFNRIEIVNHKVVNWNRNLWRDVRHTDKIGVDNSTKGEYELGGQTFSYETHEILLRGDLDESEEAFLIWAKPFQDLVPSNMRQWW